jgi:short-subunit dehydrogenase
MESMPVSDLDRQYSINLRVPYVLTQRLLPALSMRQGQIVFINSSLALTARANVGQYTLKAIADSRREEVNPKGLRVMSVFLGRTASPMQAVVHAVEASPTTQTDCCSPRMWHHWCSIH